jgi:drug/metabolite transporter (DMT)-like permease
MSGYLLLLLLLTVLFSVAGQVLIKHGALQVGASPASLREVPAFLFRAFSDLRVVLGMACGLLAAAAWVMALSRTDLSLAYPFMGLTLVLVLAMSGVLLGERVPATRWLGALIVCVGIWIASR